MAEAFDATIEFIGGQDQSYRSDRIASDKYAAGVNVTTVLGLRERPKFHHVPLTVVSTSGITPTNGRLKSYKEIFFTGRFQAKIPYIQGNSVFEIRIVSGVFFRVNYETRMVSVMTEELFLSEFRRRYNWTIAGRFVVVYDYPDRPVIIDDNEIRRSSQKDFEVPPSVLGIFNNNRLGVANALHEFIFGDPVDPSENFPDAPITYREVFGEAAAYREQSFSLGASNANEPITAMTNLIILDSSTGIGPTAVFTKNAIYSFPTDQPRVNWGNVNESGKLISYVGTSGPRTVAHANTDLFFLSPDGAVRSLSNSRDEQRRYSNSGISKEVKEYLRYTPDLIKTAVLEHHKERLFVTTNPYYTKCKTIDGRDTVDHCFRGLAVLELNNVSGLQRNAVPAWAGIWTGIQPMDMSLVGDRFTIISKDPSGTNRTYEMVEESDRDIIQGRRKRVATRIYSRAYTGSGDEANPFQDKELRSFEAAIKGDYEITVYRRPTNLARWDRWKSQVHSTTSKTKVIDGKIKQGEYHGYRVTNLGSPEETVCDPVSNESGRIFRKIQLLFQTFGSFCIEELLLRFQTVENTGTQSQSCKPNTDAVSERQCDWPSDWAFYSLPTDPKLEEKYGEKVCP